MATVNQNEIKQFLPRSSPAALAMYASGGRWILTKHLALLNRKILDLAARRTKRLIVTFPPRHGKSSFISKFLVAWWMGNFPNQSVILTSYGADLAFYWSGRAKEVLEQNANLFGGIVPEGSAGGWKITGKEGTVRAAGVGGPITGFGCDLLCADDLVKNAEEAQSETVRNSTWDWFNSTAFTRLEPNAVVVMIATRWHLDDPIGRALASKNESWEVFNLPALAEEDEPAFPDGLGRKIGDALWPERFDKDALEAIRKNVGEYWWHALYQQRPVAISGGMFKLSYFDGRVPAAPFESQRIRYWDRASSSGHGCYTAGVLMAKSKEGMYFVEHVVRGQWEPDERNRIMRATAERDKSRYGPNHAPLIWVEREGGSSGRDAWLGVVRALEGFPVREDLVTGKKPVRAEAFSCQCAARNVKLVDDGTWDVNSYIQELCLFPFGATLDMADASSGAFNLLSNRKQVGSGLQILRFGVNGKSKTLRILVCSAEELPQIIIDQNALLISFSEPDQSELLPKHGLTNLLERLSLEFADLDPKDCQNAWREPVKSYNRLPEEIKMTPAHGKKLWATILRKRNPAAEILIFQDSGNRIALSAALAVADCLRLKRSEVIYRPADPDWKAGEKDKAPNQYVYDSVRTTRNMVVT